LNLQSFLCKCGFLHDLFFYYLLSRDLEGGDYQTNELILLETGEKIINLKEEL